MELHEEQEYIKKYADEINAKGIFYIPKLKKYSATILIEQTHPIIVVNNGEHLKGHKVDYIENDSKLGYLIGEIMWAFEKEPVGIVYDYLIDKEFWHDHEFKGVIKDLVRFRDKFEVVNERSSYSLQELGEIERIKNRQSLSEKDINLTFPYMIKGVGGHVSDIEELYRLVVDNYESIEVLGGNDYYNDNQLKVIDSIIKYQKYEVGKYE